MNILCQYIRAFYFLQFHSGAHIVGTMKPSEAVAELQNLGWTQAEIAASVGSTQPTIARIKAGKPPFFDVGIALVNLAAREVKPKGRKKAA